MLPYTMPIFQWIDSEGLENANLDEVFKDTDGIILPGGFGDRGIEGMIHVATYARQKQIPYLGICLGMQIAAIAFARSALGLKDANSMSLIHKVNIQSLISWKIKAMTSVKVEQCV